MIVLLVIASLVVRYIGIAWEGGKNLQVQMCARLRNYGTIGDLEHSKRLLITFLRIYKN